VKGSEEVVELKEEYYKIPLVMCTPMVQFDLRRKVHND
jgi:hypothetical protein